VIVTCNVADFPANILNEYDIEAQHPDDFILYQKEENLSLVLEKLRKCRGEHRSPPLSIEEFIGRLRTSELPLTASWLERNNLL
jgi:hypothetical protein